MSLAIVASLRLGRIGAIRLAAVLVCVLGLGAGLPARADEFESGIAAYEAGDFAAARMAWEAALAKGDWDAARNLGTLYRRGLGVAADDAKAVAYYRQAVQHRVIAANLNLAEMMLAGRGTAKDIEGARRLLKAAADAGLAPARFRLDEIDEAESRGGPPPDLSSYGPEPPPPSADQAPFKVMVGEFKDEKAAATGWLDYNLPGLVAEMEWADTSGGGKKLRLYAVGPATIIDELCLAMRTRHQSCQPAPVAVSRRIRG